MTGHWNQSFPNLFTRYINRMKICDVVQFYSPLGGGVKRYLGDKIEYLSRQKGNEHFIIIPSGKDGIEEKNHSKFYHIKSFHLPGSLSYRLLLNRKKILTHIDTEHPDIIEVGDPYRSAWISLEAARRHQIPLVAFYHSDFPRAMGRTIKRFCGETLEHYLSRATNRYVVNLYNRMNATVVASYRIEKVLKECGINNVVRIPLGTNPAVFQPNPSGAEAVRKKLGLSDTDTLLIFVGRMAREKNIKSLAGMMDILVSQSTASHKYHLLLVGDGELRDYVQKITGNKPWITWYKYSESTEQLTAYYTAADLFVHAGHYETFGITSLEAQACGTRVLAIRNGGLDDTVAGEDPLIMAESHTPEALADGVLKIESLPYSQSQLERRERIINNLTTELLFERLISLYQHLIEQKPLDEFSYPEGKKYEPNIGLEHQALYSR